MRKLVLGLTASTLIFAASTLYLWHEVELERGGRLAALNLPSHEVVIPGVHSSFMMDRQATSAAPVTAQSKAGATTFDTPQASVMPSGQPDDEAGKRERLAASRNFLVMLQDPAQRAQLLAGLRTLYRQAYPWVGERLALSDQELEKFMDLLAKQDLANREKLADCVVNQNCTYRGLSREERSPEAQQVAELLGSDRARQFEDYRDSEGERRLVLQLRASLPDQAYLSRDLSESLIGALLEERRQVLLEAQVSGTKLGSFGYDNNMYYYNGDGSPAQRLASAEAYSQRLTTRAAQILNDRQLDAFKKMQAEGLDRLREELTRRDGNPDVGF